MSYIGKTPATGNFVKLDAITTSSTNTYNLLKDSVAFTPESANHMIVSLNGVIQAPSTAFSVSGSQITFIPASGTLSSSDTIDFILVLGNVLDIGTPSDDTISASKLQTDSVQTAKIVDDAVTKAKVNFISDATAGVEVKGDGGSNDGYIQLNCSQNSHGVKIKSPPHSAGQSYTLTLPQSITNDYFLKTDGSGNLSFAEAGTGGLVHLKTLTASNVSQLNIQNGSDGVVIDDTYDVYILKASRVYGATNDVRLQLRMKYGSTTQTSSYRQASVGVHYNGSTTTTANNSSTSYMMRSRDNIRNNYPEYFNGSFEFYSLGKASSRVSLIYNEFFRKDSSGYSFTSNGFGHVDSNQTWDGMEFEMSSGNIYGIFSLYGVKK